MRYLFLLLLVGCNKLETVDIPDKTRSESKVYCLADSGQVTCKFMTQNGSKSRRYVSLINLYTIGSPLYTVDTIGIDLTTNDTLLMYDIHLDTLPLAMYQLSISHLFTDMNGNIFASYLTPPTIIQ